MQPFDPLQVALRAYAVRRAANEEPRAAPRRGALWRHEPQRTLVLDTETTTDPSQRLNFGVWRYYVDRPDGLPGRICVEEGIFYADDLPERDPEGLVVLDAFVDAHQADVAPGRNRDLRLLSRSEFAEQVLWRHAYKHRATIVGFNLPFDLSRLAIAAAPGRSRFAGGNSLRLFGRERYRPRIAYKAIDSKRTLMGFTRFDGGDEKFHGHFLDLRTLAFALTDRSHSLESACDSFEVPYTKRPVVHGTISENYVTYCREDVEATAKLFRAAIAEYRRHAIELQETKAFSPASIGKAYLGAMGIEPILDRQPDFDPGVLGWAMAAFFGGRAECRIRKTALPVVYLDFLSMYPTVNALMGTWDLLTARRIETVEATKAIRRLLFGPDLLDRCFRRAFWSELACLVEIEPDGEVLPVRAAYDPASLDFGIGVNPFRSGAPAWYTLADVVASVVLTGRIPKIRRAIRFRPVGRQGGLQPARIRGMVDVDPKEVDFFRRAIELRREVEADPSYGADERSRLSRFLKVLANSTGYGILAEFTRHELHDPVEIVVHADRDEPFDTATATPEDPGRYCFPPLAATITGAARLMLALLERLVTDAGGSYVFCDTDSLAIIADEAGSLHSCPGGSERSADGRLGVRTLSWTQVDEIVARFAALNPYDRTAVPGSILKVEEENSVGKVRRQLWCWAISAKRYVLFRLDGDEPTIVKVSEHGLGHLLNPTDPDDESGDWISQTWEFLLRRALDLPVDEPAWLDRPALTRVTASSPNVLRWFSGMNQGRSYAEQVKPANFLLLAHPDPLDPSEALPIAPYESDASKWADLRWIDRRTGDPIGVSIEPPDGTARPGTVRVRTYRDVLSGYLGHPESKSLGPNGEAVTRQTAGLLRRRGVEAIPPTVYIGKEANRLDQRLSGLATGPEDYRTQYVDPRHTRWTELVLPVLATMDRAEVVRQSGLTRQTIWRYLCRGARPHGGHEATLTKLAIVHASSALAALKIPVPRDAEAVLHIFRGTPTPSGGDQHDRGESQGPADQE